MLSDTIVVLICAVTSRGIWVNVNLTSPEWMCSVGLMSRASQDLTITNLAVCFQQGVGGLAAKEGSSIVQQPCMLGCHRSRVSLSRFTGANISGKNMLRRSQAEIVHTVK